MADLKRADPRLPLTDDDGAMIEVEARQDLQDRLAAMFDLELLDQAKDRVRNRVKERTWSAYVGTAEEGRMPAEVARELGMKVGAVFQAKHTVITQLRRRNRDSRRSRLKRGIVVVACPSREELYRYLIQDDSLGLERLERIVDHLETCQSCQALLNGLTDDEVPPGTTLPLLPGYRVYKFLGRERSARSGSPRT